MRRCPWPIGNEVLVPKTYRLTWCFSWAERHQTLGSGDRMGQRLDHGTTWAITEFSDFSMISWWLFLSKYSKPQKKYDSSTVLPVVLHKAVAEVSKIGNLWERIVVVMLGCQNEPTDGPKGRWGSESLTLSFSLSFSLSLSLSLYICVCASIYPSIRLSVYLSFFLSMYPSIYLSLYLAICLTIDLSVCLSI